MKKSFLCIVLLIALSLVTSCSGGGGGGGGTADVTPTGTATLHWSTPTTDIDDAAITVAGYKVYYGTESGVYTTAIDVGNVTTYTVTGLPLGNTYFFAITAYDASRVESDPTDEQTKTL